MSNFDELLVELLDKYPVREMRTKSSRFNFEYFSGAGWLRICFGTNRKLFLEERDNVTKIVNSFGLHCNTGFGWSWEDARYEEFEASIHQATTTYELFVTQSSGPVMARPISDTTDELYDFNFSTIIRNLKQRGEVDFEINGFARTEFGLMLRFYSKAAAIAFDSWTGLNRVKSWKKVGRTEYTCEIYMKDKEPTEPVVSLKTVIRPSVKTKSSKPKPVKKLSADELFEHVMAGKITKAEFKKLMSVESISN